MNNTTSHRVQRQIVNIFCDLWSVPAPRQRAAFCVLQHLSVAFINFQPCILCHIICATAVRSLWLSGCQKEGLVARWQDWGVKHRRLFFFFSFFFLSFPQDVNFTEICSVQVISPAFSSSNVNAGDGLSFSQITVGGDKVEEIVQFLPPHAPFDLTVWYYLRVKSAKQLYFEFSSGCLLNLLIWGTLGTFTCLTRTRCVSYD